MTYQEFKTNYQINSQRACEFANLFGVKMAQVQLWVIRILKEGN